MNALLHSAGRPHTLGFPGALRRRLGAMTREQRWSIAGLVVAQVMVVALYMILVNNMAQVETKRRALEEQAKARHECGLLAERLERAQCMQALQVQEAGQEATVVAQR